MRVVLCRCQSSRDRLTVKMACHGTRKQKTRSERTTLSSVASPATRVASATTKRSEEDVTGPSLAHWTPIFSHGFDIPFYSILSDCITFIFPALFHWLLCIGHRDLQSHDHKNSSYQSHHHHLRLRRIKIFVIRISTEYNGGLCWSELFRVPSSSGVW